MKLLLLDFDGTITKKDSFIEFIKFSTKGVFFYSTFWMIYFIFIIHKLGFFNAKKAKELILSFYFKGKLKKDLEHIAEKFSDYLFEKDGFNSDLLKIIKEESLVHSRIIVVTASMDLWVKPFCKKYTIELIASELEYENDVFNGKLRSPNCNGEEKAIRIKNTVDLSSYSEIEVHGNSKGDIPMMKLGTKNHWY